jgi:hypothetical protein
LVRLVLNTSIACIAINFFPWGICKIYKNVVVCCVKFKTAKNDYTHPVRHGGSASCLLVQGPYAVHHCSSTKWRHARRHHHRSSASLLQLQLQTKEKNISERGARVTVTASGIMRAWIVNCVVNAFDSLRGDVIADRVMWHPSGRHDQHSSNDSGQVPIAGGEQEVSKHDSCC